MAIDTLFKITFIDTISERETQIKQFYKSIIYVIFKSLDTK